MSDATRPDVTRRPSWWWLAAAALCGAAALAAVVAALGHQRAADRPVGEGELFRADVMWAAERADAGDLDASLRHIRNALTVEAVAAVDAGGAFTAATSEGLVGGDLANGLLRFGLGEGTLAAVAGPVASPLTIDGVVEWNAGDILYQVLYPTGDGSALVLYYDVAELLERRARTRGIQPATVQLLGGAAFLGLVAVLLLIGRYRAASRYRELALEAALLRRHAAELEIHNRELEAARAEAERALALAEEKNRIRAEFVLMINHELRTPLTSVVTGARLLRESDLGPADRARLLDDMVHDGSRLQEMIGQMLAVARIENRGLDYDLRAVPLLEACAAIEEAHPRVRIEHDAGIDAAAVARLRLRTDPQTLAHLVASLTDNAYTHGATEVTLSCRPDLDFDPMLETGVRPDPAAYFTVADNGPGIDPEFLPRAFEKFEKHGFSSGTGLGLYTARMMSDAIEASLAVFTSPRGTRMAVAVPIAAEAA